MINLYRNKLQGAATLIITVILMVVSTLIIIFAANFFTMSAKATANMNRKAQALNAADAGLEFGINYLQNHSSTIVANAVAGFIPAYSDASTTNVTLANNSKFTVVYTNPVANNYKLILITSTGTSDDGTATRVVSQQVQFGSILVSPATTPLVTQGQVSMSGSATVTNTSNTKTITAGEGVSISGSSHTVLSSGTSSTSSALHSDITANSTSLQNQTTSDFFANYFGSTSTAIKNQMTHVYSNSTNTNYSSTLNGMTGTSIWIDQLGGTATINGSTTIGSSANPVLIVVNGNLSLSGNVTIYGYIFAFGTNTIDSLTGNVVINGGIATTGDLNMTGSSALTYNPTVLSNLQNLPSMMYYAKVAGSWKDF